MHALKIPAFLMPAIYCTLYGGWKEGRGRGQSAKAGRGPDAHVSDAGLGVYRGLDALAGRLPSYPDARAPYCRSVVASRL